MVGQPVSIAPRKRWLLQLGRVIPGTRTPDMGKTLVARTMPGRAEALREYFRLGVMPGGYVMLVEYTPGAEPKTLIKYG